jgi:hypothetical protein
MCVVSVRQEVGDSLAMDRSLPLSNLGAFSVGQGMWGT